MRLSQLPLMEPVQPHRLAALAGRFRPLSGGSEASTATQPSWPPRDAGQVFAELARGGRVPVLDLWRLLSDSDWWTTRMAQGEVEETARILWREAPRVPQLEAELGWRTTLHLSGLPVRLHPAVVRARPRHQKGHAWVFEMISSGSPQAMLERCLRARARPSPEQVLAKLGLPTRLPVLKGLPSLAVDHMLARPTPGLF